MSNYRKIDDGTYKKFIPDLKPHIFYNILMSNPDHVDEQSFYKAVINDLYNKVEEDIFNPSYQQLSPGQ